MSDNTGSSLRHGGDLYRAIEQYGGVANDWLDLSTCISPWSYPFNDVASSVWHNLPEPQTEILAAASRYYKCDTDHITVVPGSQLAIRLLPTLIKEHGSVACPTLGYQEHAASWQAAGHSVIRYRDGNELQTLVDNNAADHVVVITPNNPTTEMVDCDTLHCIAKRLSGLLIVDEAFADNGATQSLCSSLPVNAVVLRSVGKFFGLAGARVGFCISRHPVATKIDHFFNPWSINAAAQKIATQALSDVKWQRKQRRRSTDQSAKLESLIRAEVISNIPDLSVAAQTLFLTLFGPDATIRDLHRTLAHSRVWTRLGDRFDDNKNWLRLSLPGQRFSALKNVLVNLKMK